MRTYELEKARNIAANKQNKETNTAGWWKIQKQTNGRFAVYYDSARFRYGVQDDEHAAIIY